MYNTIIRNDDVEGFTNWLWPKEDSGLWDGPLIHWPMVKEQIRLHCQGFKTIVQAGGAAGMYPRLMSKMFETVYTFEPDPYNFHCLVHNCDMDNVIKINAALGSTHEMVSIDHHETNAGVGHVHKGTRRDVIPTFMIDDLDLDSLDCIYLDVEGYESQSILGGINSIKKFKPLIGAENGAKDALTVLEELGYKQVGNAAADIIYKAF